MQMLADRPEMKDAIPLSHPIVAELASCFDGKLKGQRVYWEGSNAPDGWPAVHTQPYFGSPPHICVTDSTDVTAIDKCALTLFEHYNVEGDFQSLEALAALGVLTRAEFVKKTWSWKQMPSRKLDFFSEEPVSNRQ